MFGAVNFFVYTNICSTLRHKLYQATQLISVWERSRASEANDRSVSQQIGRLFPTEIFVTK
jgi:hypothetical protein